MTRAILLTLALLFLITIITFSQSPPTCQSGDIKCYSDMTPYAGHGAAKNLPPNLCPNNECKTAQNENRRVVVVRINSATNNYGSIPPQRIVDAVQNAVNQWNSATDANGNTTGYYFVLDPSNLTGVTTPDITISKDSTDPYLSANTLNEPGSSARTNIININPRYTTPGDPANSTSVEDFGGSIAHEIGHLIGLVNNRPEFGNQCNSIMRGIGDTTLGTGVVKTIQPADVAAVNTHFASRNNCTKTTSQDTQGEFSDPTPSPTPPLCAANGEICQLDDDCCSFVCGLTTGFCEDEGQGGGGGCNGGFPPECDSGQSVDFDNCCCVAYAGGACLSSPILVDVLGNGFDLTDLNSGVRFDIRKEGVRKQVAWTNVGSDDAFLTLDRNRNGTIDNGGELFGNLTRQTPSETGANGFKALAEFDKFIHGGNDDGAISDADVVFGRLRLWQDLNHNGLSESNELKTLSEKGLSRIDLNYKRSNKKDQYGNIFRYRSQVKDVHGAQFDRWAWDVFLMVEP